jgi:hypothetical protein
MEKKNNYLVNKSISKSVNKSINGSENESENRSVDGSENGSENGSVDGSDIFSKRSDQASIKGQFGYPTLSKVRCCNDNNYGTPIDLLSSEPMSISDYGMPHYSSLNKCYSLNENDKKKINIEIKKNNLNPEETYVKNINKTVIKSRNANLGKEVLSYRIISKKEKAKF